MPSTSRRITTLVSLALGAQACGGAEESKDVVLPQKESAQAVAIDPCTLLTNEEIEAAAGWKVVKTEPSQYGDTRVCNAYGYGPGGVPQTVAVTIAARMPAVASSAAMAEWRSAQGSPVGDMKITVTPVEGLGVPAIQSQVEGTPIVGVEAAAKGMLLIVSSMNSETSRQLMPKALARLQ